MKFDKVFPYPFATQDSTGHDLLFLIDVTISMKPHRDRVVSMIDRVITCIEVNAQHSSTTSNA